MEKESKIEAEPPKWTVQNMPEGAVRLFGLEKKPGRQTKAKTWKKTWGRNGS